MLIALYGGHKIQQQNEAKAEKLMQNYLTNETQEEFYEKRYES